MKRIVVFGNSGAGKSTLARNLAEKESLSHLDLDTLAWQLITPPERKPLAESQREIDAFIQGHDNWVIEGCYADLLEFTLAASTEMIFLNLPIEDCIANAKRRPWEPHKYPTKEAQDANLEMLIDWIAQYQNRMDTFSEKSHSALYEKYTGAKTMLTNNQNLS